MNMRHYYLKSLWFKYSLVYLSTRWASAHALVILLLLVAISCRGEDPSGPPGASAPISPLDSLTAGFPNGKFNLKGEMKNGLKDGVWTGFYETGEKQIEAHFTQGKLSGCFSEWHQNGKLMCEGQYEDGRMVGNWKVYKSDGSVIVERNFLKSQ